MTISGTAFVMHHNFCGGVAPGIGEEQFRREPAVGGVAFRRGNHNSNTTPLVHPLLDARGNFTSALSPGTYCAVLDDKLVEPSADNACLHSDWSECDAVVDIATVAPPPGIAVGIEVDQPCFGKCYTGEYPP